MKWKKSFVYSLTLNASSGKECTVLKNIFRKDASNYCTNVFKKLSRNSLSPNYSTLFRSTSQHLPWTKKSFPKSGSIVKYHNYNSLVYNIFVIFTDLMEKKKYNSR